MPKSKRKRRLQLRSRPCNPALAHHTTPRLALPKRSPPCPAVPYRPFGPNPASQRHNPPCRTLLHPALTDLMPPEPTGRFSVPNQTGANQASANQTSEHQTSPSRSMPDSCESRTKPRQRLPVLTLPDHTHPHQAGDFSPEPLPSKPRITIPDRIAPFTSGPLLPTTSHASPDLSKPGISAPLQINPPKLQMRRFEIFRSSDGNQPVRSAYRPVRWFHSALPGRCIPEDSQEDRTSPANLPTLLAGFW